MGFLYSQLFCTPPVPTTDFSKQTVIVTGSNVGLGKEAARHFARLNAAKVILAVRNLTQGEEAKKSIEESTKRTGVVEVWKVDFSSFDSVKDFANRATSELKRLDVLCLNASIAAGQFRLMEGYESSITVNVLTTFLLLFMLLPTMQKTAKMSPSPAQPPRIAVTASEVHAYYPLKPQDYPEGEILKAMSVEEKNKDIIAGRRYAESKLLQVLVVRAIAPLLANTGVVLNMLNPGLCHSSLSREGSWILEVIKFFIARSTEVGSRTIMASAAAGKESHGMYMSDCVVKTVGSDGGPVAWLTTEEGQEMQKRVWEEVQAVLEKEHPGVTKIS